MRIAHNIDGISFFMRASYNFDFLSAYGKVVIAYTENDSGNICFGVKDSQGIKKFIKIAGAKTMHGIPTPKKAIENLQKATTAYKDLAKDCLIRLEAAFMEEGLYVTVFNWVEGECLFDHWNRDLYRNNPALIAPIQKFKNLPFKIKVSAINKVFEFLVHVENKNYVAVDFYDGSLLYDFTTQHIWICDIDFFRKKPLSNTLGKEYWGSKRYKAPEEYILDAKIDSRTNVFTMGALLFHLLGDYSSTEITMMNQNRQFHACNVNDWATSINLYNIVLKAIRDNREERYQTVAEFYAVWKMGLEE